jgi:hypothetical protein
MRSGPGSGSGTTVVPGGGDPLAAFRCRAALDLWDEETWDVLSARKVRLARDAGALTVLPLALRARIALQIFAGELTGAVSLLEELEAVAEATGSRLVPYALVAVLDPDVVLRSDGGVTRS